MRMMVRFQVPVEAGNRAIVEGKLKRVMESMMETLKPEASYFFVEDGHRGGLMAFDLANPAQVPVIAEPLFVQLHAKVDFTPVMNAEDLQKGLQQVAAAV